jgi:hypothetical protein
LKWSETSLDDLKKLKALLNTGVDKFGCIPMTDELEIRLSIILPAKETDAFQSYLKQRQEKTEPYRQF